MRPILPGSRGAAVEDVQRRLLVLGYDLGRTGVDGVFLGETRAAVVEFQGRHELSEDGIVGSETWAALVDATFTLGDRMLYLRLPYFHGNDVRSLQDALNSLGFSCGQADGIFGSFTERAVREFQRSNGQPRDGIVGPETVRSIEQLRHVWEGKSTIVPESATVASARLSEVLSRHAVAFLPRDEVAEDVATRSVNLALATDGGVLVRLADEGSCGDAGLLIELRSAESLQTSGSTDTAETPVVAFEGALRTTELAGRLAVAAEAASETDDSRIVVMLPETGAEERDRQRIAVKLLDALCRALA